MDNSNYVRPRQSQNFQQSRFNFSNMQQQGYGSGYPPYQFQLQQGGASHPSKAYSGGGRSNQNSPYCPFSVVEVDKLEQLKDLIDRLHRENGKLREEVEKAVAEKTEAMGKLETAEEKLQICEKEKELRFKRFSRTLEEIQSFSMAVTSDVELVMDQVTLTKKTQEVAQMTTTLRAQIAEKDKELKLLKLKNKTMADQISKFGMLFKGVDDAFKKVAMDVSEGCSMVTEMKCLALAYEDEEIGDEDGDLTISGMNEECAADSTGTDLLVSSGGPPETPQPESETVEVETLTPPTPVPACILETLQGTSPEQVEARWKKFITFCRASRTGADSTASGEGPLETGPAARQRVPPSMLEAFKGISMGESEEMKARWKRLILFCKTN